MRRLLGAVVVLGSIFWLPWLWLAGTTETLDFDAVRPADTGIVFGALVRNGAISPLHEERLLSAKRLLDEAQIKRIVVSNSSRATAIMANYLYVHGVPKDLIEFDGDALDTADTCRRENEVGKGRSVILISQWFHLPRLAYQCRQLGVTGQYLEAETVYKLVRNEPSLWTKIRVRGRRYAREAALTWTVLLGVYDRISDY